MLTTCAMSDLMGSEIWRMGDWETCQLSGLVSSVPTHTHPVSQAAGMEWAKLYKDNHNLFVMLQHTTEQAGL